MILIFLENLKIFEYVLSQNLQRDERYRGFMYGTCTWYGTCINVLGERQNVACYIDL